MYEFSGSLQGIELSAALWLIPLLPLLVAAISVLKRVVPEQDKAQPLSVHWHLEAALGSLGLLLFELFELTSLPAHRRFLLDTLGSALRVGSLDVGLSLSLDPLSAVVGLVAGACGVAVIAHAVLPEATKSAPTTVRRSEVLSLALGSLLLVVLASNLAVLLVGWAGASLAGYLLAAPGRGGVAFAIGRTADLLLLAGAVLLFWTLGGSWSRSGEFTPDFQARVVAVQQKAATPADQDDDDTDNPGTLQRPNANGELSLNSLPGATVSVGGAKLCAIGHDGKRGGLGVPTQPCRVVARAPFERLPVPLAMQDFRLDLGPGENPLILRNVHVPPEADIQLGIAGSTLDFREMRDQLGMRDKSGSYALRADLVSKRLWGLSALALSLLLIALAGLAKCVEWPLSGRLRERSGSLLAGGGGLIAGAYLLARFAFYMPVASTLGGLIALFGALTAIVAAAIALPSRDPARTVAAFGVGQVGLSFVGFGSGAAAGGVLELAIVVLATLALLLGVEDLDKALGKAPDLTADGGLGTALPRSARAWFIAALAATAAPYPFVGVFWPREALLWGAFTSGTTGAIPSAAPYLLGVIGAAGLCFAVWRAYFLLFTGKAGRKQRPLVKNPPPAIHTRIVLGLAWLSLVVGLLEASDRVLDSASPLFPAILDSWLGPLARATDLSFNDLGTGMRLGLLLVGFGVPLFAWSAARRRYGPGRAKDWVKAEQRMKLLRWLERIGELRRLAASVGRSVMALGATLERLDGALAFGGAGMDGGTGDSAAERDSEADKRDGADEGDDGADEGDDGADEGDDGADEGDDDGKREGGK